QNRDRFSWAAPRSEASRDKPDHAGDSLAVEPTRPAEPHFTLGINNVHLWLLAVFQDNPRNDRLPVRSHRVFVLQAQVFGMAISQRPFNSKKIDQKYKATAAAACRWHYVLVARTATLLRRFAAGADLGVLATSPSHVSPSHAGADVAKAGRARTGSG